ncbi:MAG: MerR family transcriptional regulator [Sandaracinaceae bacterium]
MPTEREQQASLPTAPAEDEDGPRGCSALTTGDLARACQTTLRTVRFYEEAGLLCPEARSDGGHRQFADDELAKLQLIMDLREAGLSLNDIKALFQLKQRSSCAEEASAKMSDALGKQIGDMQRKIAILRRLREEMAAMLTVLEECRSCDAREFPARCQQCDVMARPDLPRAMRLLWGS